MPSTTLNLGRVKGSMWYTGTADSNVDIASALTSAGYTPIKLDMYLNTSNGNVYQYSPVDDGLQWTLKGNLRGAKGEGFQIKKTYASVSAMNAGYATDGLPVGSFVMISSNVDDPDNAKLYVKGEIAYTFVTDFSGAQGIKGDKGDTGTTSSIVKTAAEWESQNPVLGAGVFGFDSTNKIIKAGDGTTAWNALPAFSTTRFTFATAAWGDISRIAAAGDAQKYFNVGDEKTVGLSTGEVITLVILGFNHDDLTSGGKAPITVGMKNLLATRYRMNSSDTNAGGWDESEMRTSTMATLLSQLPSDLRAVIKSVDKKATSGSKSTTITTSADKLFLFSEVEIDGTTSAGYADEGEQYEYWKTVKDGTVAADRIKYLSNGSGSAHSWWSRSPSVSSTASFRDFNSTGNVGSVNASNTRGVSFGFCV